MTVSYLTKDHHIAALYDACAVIVDTYLHTDMLDGADTGLYTPFQMMKSARLIMNQIAEGNLK
jgi:hypothetical protein